MNYLQEAFKKFEVLNEEELTLDDAGVDELETILSDNKDEIDFVDVIDPEAETEEDLEDSYIGKVILDCNVCHSKIYKDASEVNLNEEDGVADEGEECPFCYSMDGYTIVGQVAPYKEEEVKVEVEPKEDEDSEEEVEVDDEKNESLKSRRNRKNLYESIRNKKRSLRESIIGEELLRSNNGNFVLVTNSGTGVQNTPWEGLEVKSEGLAHKHVVEIRLTSKFPKFEGQPVHFTYYPNGTEVAHGMRMTTDSLKDTEEYISVLQEAVEFVPEIISFLENHPEWNAGSRGYQNESLNEASDYELARPYNIKLLNIIDKYDLDVWYVLDDILKFLPDDTIKEYYEDLCDYLEIEDESLKESLKQNKGSVQDVVDKIKKLASKIESIQDRAQNLLTNYNTKDSKIDDDVKLTSEEKRNRQTALEDEYKSRLEELLKDITSDMTSLKEGLENLDIETEHDRIHVSAEEKEDSDAEMIAPLEPEVEAEIKANGEDEEPEEDEVEIDDFEEDSFNEIGESYLKKVYENVDSFKTSKVRKNDNSLVVEGVIKFKSGKEKSTSFKFEAKEKKNNKLRLVGENLQITKGRKSFTLKGILDNKKFISESLNYNYKVDGNRVYGTVIVNESDSEVKKIKELNRKKEENKELAKKYKNKKTPGEVECEESLKEDASKKDLSTVEGSMSKILQDNHEELDNSTSKEELIGKVKKLFSDNKLDTPATKRLLMNMMKSKSLSSALQTMYNSLLAGSNLTVDRK